MPALIAISVLSLSYFHHVEPGTFRPNAELTAAAANE